MLPRGWSGILSKGRPDQVARGGGDGKPKAESRVREQGKKSAIAKKSICRGR